MPQVTDTTDILEATSPADESDYTCEHTRGFLSSRHGRPTLLPILRGRLTSLLRLHTHREQTYSRQMPQPATMSIDLLARKYPNLHRRITSWSI
jgi:hypothetical protein